jgi:hypothetical protein
MLLPPSQLRMLTHSVHSVPLAVAILAAVLTTAPAVAQSRPDTTSGTATAHPVTADSIASQMKASVPVRVAPSPQLQVKLKELDLVDDGSRPATFLERLGFASIFTAVGAGLGYAGWQTCNDPETEIIIRCIIAPRRLETSVRIGAYSGLAVGLMGLVGDLRVRVLHSRFRAADPGLLIGHQALSGFRVGVNFRF